jgi:uncharacterized protein (UPF0254 family)
MDEYTGMQVHRIQVTFSLIEHILDAPSAADHVYDYIDELRRLIFVTHRKWKRGGDSDLGIITTLPIGWNAAPISEASNHFIVQADIQARILVPLNFY